MRRHPATARVTGFLLATALMAALVIHASHWHDDPEHATQLHATCVVCQLGSPVAAQSTPAAAAIDSAPICQLSIADRDHAIPPARVEVDLSRAPPALRAS